MLSSKGHQLWTKEAWGGSGEPCFLSGSLYTQQLLDSVLSLRETMAHHIPLLSVYFLRTKSKTLSLASKASLLLWPTSHQLLLLYPQILENIILSVIDNHPS